MNFTDSLGRVWPMRLDYVAAQRVRHMTGVNLLDLSKFAENLERLRVDSLFVCQSAQAILEPALYQRQVSETDFAAGMNEDAVEACSSSIVEALICFFPKGRRATLTMIRDKVDQLLNQAMTQVDVFLNPSQSGSEGSNSEAT